MTAPTQARPSLRTTARRAKRAEDPFRVMADHAPVMIWLADPDGNLVFFNRRWLDFRGREPAQETGAGWLEGVHPLDRARCGTAYGDAFAARKSFEVEFQLRRSDGAYRHVRATGAPVLEGREGFVGSCVDITEEIGPLLADVCHELRSPLNGIKSWTHVLENCLADDPDETLQRAVHGIKIGVEEQVRLIETLLDEKRR